MFSLLVTSVLIGSVVFLLCTWLVRRPKNLPPGPWSLSPLGYRCGPGLIHECYADLARRYGPIFSLRLGTRLIVVLNNKQLIRQGLIKNADILSERFVPGHIKRGLPPSNDQATPVWSNGEPWHDLRRFGLTSLRAYGMGKKSLEPQINLEARCLCEELEALRGRPADVHHIINKATANVICQLCYGRRYDYHEKEYEDVLWALFSNFTAISGADLVMFLPFLFDTPLYRRFRENRTQLINFTHTQIDFHRNSFQRANIRDITDAFIADDISQKFSIDVFWRIVVDFFTAGTETTSTALSWAILYLAQHPDIQQKVHAELDTVVGRGRQPTMSDRPNLPYCDATISETMRIQPPIPTSLPHQTATDISLGGYNIPKGTVVIPNLWAAHHDSNEWPDPEVFDPDRFLDDDGEKIKNADGWMPFSVGRRECLGAQLAKMEAFLFFTNLFQRFEFRFPDGKTGHTLRGLGGLTNPPEPYEICAIER